MTRTLIIGYGNPGRLDDGLGPAFAERASAWAIPGVDVDSDYQLTVDLAAEVPAYDRIIFVDADETGPAPFSVRRLELGSVRPTFSSHYVDAAGVLALASDLFDARPEAWMVGIRGYDFNAFGEWLSADATHNLEQAVTYVRRALSGTLREVRHQTATTE